MMIDINGRFRQLLPEETDRWIDRAWMFGLVLMSLVLMFWQLGALPLQDWYEGTIGQVAKNWLQSLEGMEAIDALLSTMVPWQSMPTQIENLRLPPILYWGVALSYGIGGVNETLSRLPSAVLTACSVPLMYALGRELFSGRMAAVVVSVLYLTCLPIVRLGRMAAPPGALLFELLLLLLCLMRSRRDLRWTLGLGLVTGLICMTEGLMGLLWGALGIAFLAWDTPRLLRCGYLWWGLGLGLLPLGVWYGVGYWSQGWLFLKTQLFMAAPIEAQGSLPWGWAIAMKVGFPEVLFLPSAIVHLWKNRDLSWAKFLLSWAGVYGFLVVMGLRHSFPVSGLALYPWMALTVGGYLAQRWLSRGFLQRSDAWLEVWSSQWFDQGLSHREMKLWSWGFAVITVALGSVTGWCVGEGWHWTAGSLGLLAVSCGLGVILCRQERKVETLAVLAWGSYLSLILFVSSDQWIWELKTAYPVQPVAQMIAKRTPENLPIYTSHLVHRPSLDFYSDRMVIPASMAQLEQHLLKDHQPYLLMDLENAKRLPKEQVKFLSQVRVQVQGQPQTWALVTRKESNVKPKAVLGPQVMQKWVEPLF
jgi:4-amino-4-deoxy-L-arabinose transferase-like glycosyltransferase